MIRNSPAVRPATREDLDRNIALRSQYNGAKINIGMTEHEVEAVFGAKPICSGYAEGGHWKIFGSDESFNIQENHFANILVLFRDGQTVAAYSLTGGESWRYDVRRFFSDLVVPLEPARR